MSPRKPKGPLLSVVIPARNESVNLEPTILEIVSTLDEAAIPFEIEKPRIDETALRTSVASIAETEGRLRTTHLKYHLIMKSILNRTQLAAYNRLRGYGDGKAAKPAMPAGHHGR